MQLTNKYIASWTAIVPVRAGSKGLPNKNIMLLAGKPLYMHAVDLALKAGASKVVISTDIPEIIGINFPETIEVIRRPINLCGDEVDMAPVLIHVIQEKNISGLILLLQATSPLREEADILSCIRKHITGKFDLTLTVSEVDSGILKCGTIKDGAFLPISNPIYCTLNRQNLPKVYKPNGAIYVMNAEWLLLNKSLVSNRTGAVSMPAERSYDIDSLDDFKKCHQHLILHR